MTQFDDAIIDGGAPEIQDPSLHLVNPVEREPSPAAAKRGNPRAAPRSFNTVLLTETIDVYNGRSPRRRVPPRCSTAAPPGSQPSLPVDPGYPPQPGGPEQTRRKTALLNNRGERQASMALGLLLQHRRGLGNLPREPNQGADDVDCAGVHEGEAGRPISVPGNLRRVGSLHPVSFAEQEEVLGAGKEEGFTWATCKLHMPGSWQDGMSRGCEGADEPASPTGSSYSAWEGSGAGLGQVTWLQQDRILRASHSLGSGPAAGPTVFGPPEPEEGSVCGTGPHAVPCALVDSKATSDGNARSLEKMKKLSLSASFARLRRPQAEFSVSDAAHLDPPSEEAEHGIVALEPDQATQSSSDEPPVCPGQRGRALVGPLSRSLGTHEGSSLQQGSLRPLDRSVSDFPRRAAPGGVDGRLSGGPKRRLTRLSSVMMSRAAAQEEARARPGLGGGLRLDRGDPGVPRSPQRFLSSASDSFGV